MNKWERLNSELADARHYADDMKERAQKAERENATLSAKFAAVPEYTHYYAEAWRQMFDVDDVPLSFEDWYASRKVPA